MDSFDYWRLVEDGFGVGLGRGDDVLEAVLSVSALVQHAVELGRVVSGLDDGWLVMVSTSEPAAEEDSSQPYKTGCCYDCNAPHGAKVR